jgi:Predicted dehydrogenases and related proteins
MNMNYKINRRSFLKNSALVGALGTIGTTGAASMLTSCKEGSNSSSSKPIKEPGTYYIPDLVDFAIDGKELKAGLVGCGGQGSGITLKFLEAANGITITALGDVFKERIDAFADTLKKEKNIDVPESNRFVGLDSYKHVIDSGVDIVILATPPVFRPIHFQYATEKGKHSFLEKPVCVDPTGYRLIIATAKQADAKNLCVVTGTQRRHQRCYVETYKRVMDGMIGKIVNGIVFWNKTSQSWRQSSRPEWGDGEAMLRNWSNWKWLSGDHIVEQHLHNIDVFMWFSGVKPKTAVGFGSRQRRLTGDQFDNFSVDFEMENGSHMHSYCRQIFGCSGKIGEIFQGTKGTLALNHDFNTAVFKDLDDNIIWEYDFEAEKAKYKQTDPYVLQFVNWINHIRSGKPVNQAPDTAIPNLTAIMGRESSYKGVNVKWDEIIVSPLDYMPKDLNLGKMDMSAFNVEIPGKPDARIKV